MKIAVCQVPDICEDISGAIHWIQRSSNEAVAAGAEMVCLPECFLQGYLTEESRARQHALDLSGNAFKLILQQLADYKPAIIFGLIEKCNGHLFNTAVVIKAGSLLGKYRKTHLLKGERLFQPGNDYPVFNIDGLIFGINICYDTQFSEPAKKMTELGATVILCPANNMMKLATAKRFKHLHHEMRIPRAVENGVWLLSADITGRREGRIAYGPTSAIDPTGKVLAQVPSMKTGMIIVDINAETGKYQPWN